MGDYGMDTNRKRIGFWKKEGKESYLSSPIGFYEGKKVRITLWPNFNRNDGTNQPYFFGLVNDHFDFDDDVYENEMESPITEMKEELSYLKSKINKLSEVLSEGRRNADYGELPSVSREKADMLFHDAIQIIEELTGEKWEFSFTTWY